MAPVPKVEGTPHNHSYFSYLLIGLLHCMLHRAAFKEHLEASASPEGAACAVSGACNTFEVLHGMVPSYWWNPLSPAVPIYTIRSTHANQS